MYDFRTQRLYVTADLGSGAILSPDNAQASYLTRVLRLKDGAGVMLFNGRDGEWRAVLRVEGRRDVRMEVAERTREQPPAPGLRVMFAPLKAGRMDYMVQKMVEMGAGRLSPVTTDHTHAKAKPDKMAAHAIEAAEQCGVLSIPAIDAVEPLAALLDGWAGGRLVFCDEDHGGADAVSVLSRLEPGPLTLLIGPEGGFSEAERERLRALAFVTALPLGPRILRADTAAVAAMAVVQAHLGDWRSR